MAIGRNFKINVVYAAQRLSDLNTQLVERSAYLISKMIRDNNLRKISNVLGISRKKLTFIETMQKGEFICYNGERIERLKLISKALELST